MTSLLHRTAKSTRGKLALALLGVLALAVSASIVYAATKKPDFKLSVTKSKSVSAGGSTNFTVKVKRMNGFKKNVTLGVKGLPGGAKAAWKSKTKVKGKVVAAAGCKKKCNVLDSKTSSATLTVTTSNGTPIGADQFQVAGKGGGVSHTVKNLQLVVQPPAGVTGQTNTGTGNTGTGNTGTGNTGSTGGGGGGGTSNPPPPIGTFSISPSPSSRSVVKTDSTSYTINIDRSGGFTGDVSFGVSGLPAGTTATFAPGSTTTGNSVTMTVQTTGATPTGGPTTLTVTGTGNGTSDQTTTVSMTVQDLVDFGISGDAVNLAPGVTTPLDLQLSNPYSVPLQVTALNAAKGALTGGGSAHGGCLIGDFSLTQINRDLSTSPITLPANASNVSLSSLMGGSTNLPKVTMTDTGVNQDDCKGASLGFTYSGSAHS